MNHRMSEIGTFRTLAVKLAMSAHQGKADIGTNIAPDGSRTLLHNRITIGG
jgi:hypothetical protein